MARWYVRAANMGERAAKNKKEGHNEEEAAGKGAPGRCLC